MVCIYCTGETQVVNSRLQRRANQVWRRRKCLACHGVVTTLEAAALDKSLVVKSRAGLQPFNRDKLFLSVYESCKHRPDALEAATALTTTVMSKLLPQIGEASLSRETIVQTTSTILHHFDAAAAVHYDAYHPQ